MHRKPPVGIGPANLVRSIIVSGAVYLITGSFMQSLAFFGFYVIFTIANQLVGLEHRQ
jgi:hypothetical protein